ncbi:MAG: FGGY-family carbohydrate kinase [Pseudomonadota bacterium]|nr:FGGY-family carbohydrate kinase [Pseudomonadota bacterium]
MDKTLLAIDNGTQSIRALLFSLEGELLAKSKVDIDAYYSNQPGWAEQDPDYFWNKLCAACQGLWTNNNVDRATIASIALTTQRSTVVNLDRQGNPLRPAMVWLDQRHLDQVPKLKGPWRYLIKAAGGEDILNYYRSQAECNWIAHHQPDIWQATDKFLLLSGYLNHKLCGRYADSTASQVGYLPFDFKQHRWCSSFDWRWQALTVKPRQLPALHLPGTVIGNISKAASDATGLPLGLPLVAAGSDKACEVIGSGALSPSIGHISYGTTATFNTTSPRYFETTPMLPPYPAAIPRHYSTEVIVHRGYWMVNWFKREFAREEMTHAAEQGIAVETLFEPLLASVPAGSMGLTLQPYWSPGLRIPGPEAKGAIIGFGDVHTRAHLYRAIVEGIAYALREGKERVEKQSRKNIHTLMVSGGGSQSDGVMQITADIFGMEATRPHTYETSGLGAAINGAIGAGLFDDHRHAIKAMTHRGRAFTPQPQNQKLYDQLFKDVYAPLYERLKPLYQSIRRIVGYP